MPSWHGAQFKKKHRDNFYHVRVGKKILDTYMTWSEIWGFHSNEDSSWGLTGCDHNTTWHHNPKDLNLSRWNMSSFFICIQMELHPFNIVSLLMHLTCSHAYGRQHMPSVNWFLSPQEISLPLVGCFLYITTLLLERCLHLWEEIKVTRLVQGIWWVFRSFHHHTRRWGLASV